MTTSDSPSSERQFNTRLGLILFVVYLAFYLIFVLINAFAANVMETVVVAGLNLAIVYGFGLIGLALLLALIYGGLCRNEPLTSSVDAASHDAADQAGDVK
jgi:uncharacterized membrane protein (DUF485 family)